MTDVQQGWYTDPAGGAGQRWWDGGQWTGATRPAPVEVPAYGQAAAQQPYVQQPYGQSSLGQPGYGSQPAYGQIPYAGAPASAGTLFQRNRYSAITAAVSVVYLLIAFTTSFVFIGLVPIVFTVRAFRNRERLAPVAAVVAAVAIVVSLAALASR